jgi:hypothetical protein
MIVEMNGLAIDYCMNYQILDACRSGCHVLAIV